MSSDNRRSAGHQNKPNSRGGKPDPHDADGVRLQKVLSQAGVASRRKAEEMIAQGRVQVDGILVTELGTRVDPENAIIHVDGDRIQLDDRSVYLALNKMPGVLSTMSDDQGRPHVGRLLDEWSDEGTRLFHVGRLDMDSEGLLLFTNDGELSHRLTHPSYGVLKTYEAEVPGPIGRTLERELKRGIELEDGPVKVHSFKVIDYHNNRALVQIILHEGRKHIVRRLLEEVGHPVSRLVRTQIGEVRLGHQRPGTLRKLNPVEIAQLYKAVGL